MSEILCQIVQLFKLPHNRARVLQNKKLSLMAKLNIDEQEYAVQHSLLVMIRFCRGNSWEPDPKLVRWLLAKSFQKIVKHGRSHQVLITAVCRALDASSGKLSVQVSIFLT